MQPTYAVQIPKRFWECHRWSGLEHHIPALNCTDSSAVDARIERETKYRVTVRLTVEEMEYLRRDAVYSEDCIPDAKDDLKHMRWIYDEDSEAVAQAKHDLATRQEAPRTIRIIDARLREIAR
jgi:hypothetical protein